MIKRTRQSSLPATLMAAALAGSARAALPLMFSPSSGLANTASDQQIQLFISGTDQIAGENLDIQVNDGTSGPILTSVDILTSTIFGSDNTGQNGSGIVGGTTSFAGHVATISTTTSPVTNNTVSDTGLLLTLTINTNGQTSGTFQLNLLNTKNGNTTFFRSDSSPILPTFPNNTFVIGGNAWNVNGGGTWNASGNWTPALPSAAGDGANFLGALSAGAATVTLDGNRTVGTIFFSNDNASYTVAQGINNGSLILDNGTATPTITDNRGNHAITAPITLTRSTNVIVAGGSVLTLGGAITGVGTDLNISGLGTLVLAGDSTGLSGSVAINSGTVVASSNQLTPVSILGTGPVILGGPGSRLQFSGASGAGNSVQNVGNITGLGGLGSNTTQGTVAVDAPVQVTAGAVRAGSLTVAGSLAIAGNSAFSKVMSLSIAHTGAGSSAVYSGVLQLNNNRMVVETADAASKAAAILAINEALLAGKGIGNNWTGTTGITSSAVAANNVQLTVGVFDNAHIGRTNFAGGVGNVDTNSLLISPAIKGDLNLDGVVDVNDLALLGAHWQQTGLSNGISTLDMTQGDINQDGKIDINDLALLGANWQATSSFNLMTELSDPTFTSAFTGSLTPIPEPASSAMLILAVPLLLRRRRIPERPRA